jgi:hypothetical protein
MTRGRGGFIGANVVPAVAAASGVWTLREQESAKRAGTWPFIGSGVVLGINGLQLWLDSSDANTLFDATTGGSLVAADGGVARWEDKSGNARHYTQSNSDRRPARKTNQQNGLDTLLLDGTNDHLIGGDYLDLNSTNSLTVFCVIKTLTSDANGYEIINKRHSPAGVDSGWALLVWTDQKLQFICVDSNSYYVTNSNSTVSANNCAVFTLRTASGSLSASTNFHRNGSSLADTNAFTDISTGPDITKKIMLGINESGGEGSGTFQRPFSGHFCEFIIYNSILSDVNRAAVESYLTTKWGIT